MSAERKGRADGSGVSSAAASRETLRRYADYAIRHGVKFNDGRGNDIEVGPTIVALLDEIDRLREVHRAEQRRSADRLRECLEQKP